MPAKKAKEKPRAKKLKVKIADAKSWDLILKPFTDRK